jgi:dolichol-phosphate mannosyltransferase
VKKCGIIETVEKETGLSIVLPTRNEAGNIGLLLEKIDLAVKRFCGVNPKEVLEGEIILVDDSDDDTAKSAGEFYERKNFSLPLRIVPGERKGLGPAFVKGFANSRYEHILVMDTDLQHPPEEIPAILDVVKRENPDIIILSRFLKLSGKERKLTRKIITGVGLKLQKIMLPGLKFTDTTTGFFLVRRNVIPDNLETRGFKILLEILCKGNYRREKVVEMPFNFGERHKGKSKLGLKQIWEYWVRLVKLSRESGRLRKPFSH